MVLATITLVFQIQIIMKFLNPVDSLHNVFLRSTFEEFFKWQIILCHLFKNYDKDLKSQVKYYIWIFRYILSPIASYNCKCAEWRLFALCVLPLFSYVLYKRNLFHSNFCNLDNHCLCSNSNLRNSFVMHLRSKSLTKIV